MNNIEIFITALSIYTTIIFFLWRTLSRKVDKDEFLDALERIEQRDSSFPTKETVDTIAKDVIRHDDAFKLLFEKIGRIENDITYIKTQLSFLDGRKLLQEIERLKVMVKENGNSKDKI